MVQRAQYCFEHNMVVSSTNKILEQETQSDALTFLLVLETILECSKTVLNTLNHCLLRLVNPHKRDFSLPCISKDFENQSDCKNLVHNCLKQFASYKVPKKPAKIEAVLITVI